jgi:hypothetical protein
LEVRRTQHARFTSAFDAEALSRAERETGYGFDSLDIQGVAEFENERPLLIFVALEKKVSPRLFEAGDAEKSVWSKPLTALPHMSIAA